jgi:predicted phosphodiesterase
MNILNYEKIDLALAVGDIHGEFKKLVHKLLNNKKLENTLAIICGDVGVGFYKDNYYHDLFKKLNNKLKEKNVTLIGLRGNHDNPNWFDGKMVNLSHIKMVPDYTFINIKGNYGLLIGGARSTDRVFWNKITQEYEYRVENKDYWEGELMKPLDMDLLKKIDFPIKYIFTHSRPNLIVGRNYSFYSVDETLESDIKEENKILNNLVNFLEGEETINWYNGHFHESGYFTYKNIILNSLNIMEFKEI